MLDLKNLKNILLKRKAIPKLEMVHIRILKIQSL